MAQAQDLLEASSIIVNHARDSDVIRMCASSFKLFVWFAFAHLILYTYILLLRFLYPKKSVCCIQYLD
jgi:hypothetical protein